MNELIINLTDFPVDMKLCAAVKFPRFPQFSRYVELETRTVNITLAKYETTAHVSVQLRYITSQRKLECFLCGLNPSDQFPDEQNYADFQVCARYFVY